MSIKIGIMGLGRIGRNIFRILHSQNQIEVVAIADIVDPEALGYLLNYDTVFGRFPDPVFVKGHSLFVKGREVQVVQAKEPKDVDWRKLGVDIVIDASAKYKTRASLSQHLENGARKVILTGPCEFSEVDITLIRGVNDAQLTNKHNLISAGSITTNCIGLIIKILNSAFGIENAFLNTVHAYTNAQRLADVPHDELRLSRAAAENIIPAESKVPLSIEYLFPELKGKVDAIAMNVPVPNGSCVDLVCHVSRDVSVESINETIKSAAASAEYGTILEYVTDPIVSSDVIRSSHSAVFDSMATQVLQQRLVKTLTWFDNGWGYSNRIVEIVKTLSEMKAL